MGPPVTVRMVGMVELRAALKEAADGTAKQLTKGLRTAGGIVQKQAQTNASWSSKIPGTIKVSVTKRAVSVLSKSGEAVSYETHGKHPVWSKDRTRWNKVPLIRPFLKPAADTEAEKVAVAILDAVTDISLFKGA